MEGWTPVTTADGTVLGWTAPADVETPRERAHRGRVAGLRADAIDQVADLFGDPAFDPGQTYDAAEAWGMPGAAIDAAAHVAVALREIELGHGGQ
jgi:hypothetical protein